MKNDTKFSFMTESPIGQRIKFLISQLGYDVVSFSRAIGTGDTTVRNYYNRGSKPNADFFEKLTNTFESVNLNWLLSGKGEPFLADSGATAEPRALYQKNVSGIAQTGNNSKATQNNINLDDCKKDLQAANEKIALLTSQLADKERIIQLLEKSGKTG